MNQSSIATVAGPISEVPVPSSNMELLVGVSLVEQNAEEFPPRRARTVRCPLSNLAAPRMTGLFVLRF